MTSLGEWEPGEEYIAQYLCKKMGKTCVGKAGRLRNINQVMDLIYMLLFYANCNIT